VESMLGPDPDNGSNVFCRFYIFLTVHLRIILVSDQLDAQFLIDLHTGRLLIQNDYTRGCINTVVLLRMSTDLLETCRRFK
jgi:hypothetical protein